jgi:XapX domain-containing protein
MKPYLLSLAVGLLVGAIYSLFGVRSPAPPVIALVGLLGILAGEQLPPLVQQLFRAETRATSWLHQQVKPHMFGELPRCATNATLAQAATPSDATTMKKDHHHG